MTSFTVEAGGAFSMCRHGAPHTCNCQTKKAIIPDASPIGGAYVQPTPLFPRAESLVTYLLKPYFIR